MRETAEQLPAELSSFIGRSRELAAIERAVAPGRVVTLVGPGGCGKTRLALRVCRELADSWADGVCWIDLAEERDDATVGHRAAAALGLPVPAGTGAVGVLTRALAERARLLVFDNCEQVRHGVAELVTEILGACGAVGVLATSRAPLAVGGEQVRRIPPLELGDALELFLRRAGAADPTPEARAAARHVCDRLDRLPLALELAAGWAGTLSLAQLANSLREPYAVLDGGAVTAPFRQRTLAESMRWSHDLLSADEQLLFRRSGVFEPGYAAAELVGVCGLPEPRLLRALRGLIEKSLVSADTDGAVARYRMLGVVREYALLRLDEAGERDSTRDAHLDRYLAAVTDMASLLESDKDAWRTRIELDYSNIRAAIDWGLDGGDTTSGRDLAASMAWFWHLGPQGVEGLSRLRRAAEYDTGDELHARVLVATALVADTAEPGPAGYETASTAVKLAAKIGAEAEGRLAGVLCAIGRLGADMDGAYADTVAVHEEAVRAGDGFVIDSTGALIGLLHLLRDEHRLAIEQLGPAAEGLLRRGDRAIASSALAWLALATTQSGNLFRATELAQRAIVTAEPLQDFHRIGAARGTLAEILVRQGRTAEAEAVLAPIDRLIAGAEARPYIPGWERVHALLALAEGRPDGAVDWCRQEGRAYGHNDDALLTPWTKLVLAMALRERAHGEDFASAGELLRELEHAPMVRSMPSVHAAVLDQQAFLLCANDSEQALRLHHEALRRRADHELTLGCIDSLEALAAVLTHRGSAEPAAALAGAAHRARTETGSAPQSFATELTDRLRARATEHFDRGGSMELSRAVDYATKARGRRNRPDSGWESLTPTERSVVDLAAAGLSNPDIATRLFISRGTVKTHLAHIYAKLGVANRTELAGLHAAQQ